MITKISGLTLTVVMVLGLALNTRAQTFSVASSPPGTGAASFSGIPPDDILLPGPAPILPGAGGFGALGAPPFIDTDAICYGYFFLSPFGPHLVAHYEFGLSMLLPPGGVGAVAGEAAVGDHIADIFSSDGSGSNLLLWDGGSPGPGIPLAGILGIPEPGADDVDAWANNLFPGFFGSIFFSVDPFAAFTLYGGTFSPSDVLISPAGAGYDAPGVPVIYAGAPALFLDSAGFGTDDIDALVVIDDGDLVFGGGVGVDTILFSLSPVSMSLTTTSPYFGLSPGDILFADSTGVAGLWLPEPAIGIGPGADLNALDIKIQQQGYMVDADTNGTVTTLWMDLVPTFAYTVQVADASAPYFTWTDIGVLGGVGVGPFFDTNKVVAAGSDNAGNYTPATFTNGSNAGSGFGPWSFVLGGSSVIGLTNSTAGAGDVNSGNGLSFYLYGDTSGNYADLIRPFDAPLKEGEKLHLKFSYNFDGGNRGLDVLDAASNGLVNVRVTPIDTLTYQFAGESAVTVATNYNGGTSVVAVTVTQLAGNQLGLSLTRNDGIMTNATSTALSSPGAIVKFYNGGHAGNNLAFALFLNDLVLERGIKTRLYRAKQQPW